MRRTRPPEAVPLAPEAPGLVMGVVPLSMETGRAEMVPTSDAEELEEVVVDVKSVVAFWLLKTGAPLGEGTGTTRVGESVAEAVEMVVLSELVVVNGGRRTIELLSVETGASVMDVSAALLVDVALKVVKGGMIGAVLLPKIGASVMLEGPPVMVAVVLAGTDVGAAVVLDMKVVVGTSWAP